MAALRKISIKSVKNNRDLLKFGIFVLLIIFGFLLGSNRNILTGYLANVKSGGLFPAKLSASEEISPAELNKLLEKKPVRSASSTADAGGNFTFINVHTPYEGEIAKTDSFLDYDSLIANKDKLPKDKNAEIILYCKSGNMSAEALNTLKGLGYKNVRHLKGGMDAWKGAGYGLLDLSSVPSQVLPEAGFELPIAWSDMGPKLSSLGVIDKNKFEKTLTLTDEQKEILNKETDSRIRIDAANSQFVVDMLWAFGLAQKSIVYEDGPMGQEYKKDIGNFASTGGWSLASGKAVNYLNKYNLVPLTAEQQQKVGEIAKGVFRPCCGNSTWFPDCNHGMAALAAIELMVAKGMPDEEIYKNVLKLNSFWFPDHYLSVATYFARQGTSWDKVDAKLVLGEDYSSAKSAGRIYQQVGPLPYGGIKSGGCGA